MNCGMNPYTVHNATTPSATTASSWDEIPFDNQLMIWRNVYEQERAERIVERYRPRVLRFQLIGFISEAEREELRLGVEHWTDVWNRYALANDGLNFEDWPPLPTEQLNAIEARLETRLRSVFDGLFRADTQDEVNLTAEAWTQVVWRIQAVLPESTTENGYRHAQIRATSTDGLHRVRLWLVRLPEGGPYVGVRIRYYGPQRFRTGGVLDRVRGANMNRGGTMQEFHSREQLQVRGLDDPRVFENWAIGRA
jgi:hypothetical protein